jgi:hypothetical protein
MLTCEQSGEGPCPAYFAGRPDWCQCRVQAAAAADREHRRQRREAIAKTWVVATVIALPLAALIVRVVDLVM